MAVRKVAATTEEKRIRGTYISGNVVPKPAYEPQQEPKREPQRAPRRAPRQEERIEQNPAFGYRRSIDFTAVVMLLAAFGIVAFFLVQYLSVAAKNMELDKQINQLTEEYSTLCNDNRNRMESIVDEMDLNEVYELAVGKLGMVYPKDNQVIGYAYQGEGYVRQYAAIPDVDLNDKTALEDALDRFFRR